VAPVNLSKIKDPSVPSVAARIMAPRIALMDALMGGTEALRAAGETYLPRYEAESSKNYEYRRNRSVLLNIFKRSVSILVGKPFSKPIQIKDDFPQALLPLVENVDRNGNHLNTFARNVFQDALVNGLTHVLIEYPDVAAQAPGTLADERALNASPYFCHVPHRNIIAAYAENIHGEERLSQVRIKESTTSVNGWEEQTVEQVRVLYPDRWEIWQKNNKYWEIHNSGVNSLGYIPLLTFYTEREDFMVSRPPLTDLAHLNIAHYQSSSDQRNILTLTRFPLLAARGLNDEEATVDIGPNKLLTSQSKDGEFYYVEHSGAAIAAGRADLEDLKLEMAMIAVDLTRRGGSITATEISTDTAQSTSLLQDLAMRFGDFLESCFNVAGQWIGIPESSSGSLSVNSDFGLTSGGADQATLIKMREMREISHDQFVEEMKRRNVLSDDFNSTADKALLADEADKAMTDAVLQAQLLSESTPTNSPAPAGA
jgi:hypothetical protein